MEIFFRQDFQQESLNPHRELHQKETMDSEDGSIDDSIGTDTDFETEIEENPHTSITINFGYVLAFAFGTYAFFPRKKKNK